jgi:hypothetical protein
MRENDIRAAMSGKLWRSGNKRVAEAKNGGNDHT